MLLILIQSWCIWASPISTINRATPGTLASLHSYPVCNAPGSVCEIDAAKYLGEWYDIGHTTNVPYGTDYKCIRNNYSASSPKDVQLDISAITLANNEPRRLIGRGEGYSSSQYRFNFPGIHDDSTGPNYTIQNVWMNNEGQYIRALVTNPRGGIWVLSRIKTLPQSEVDEMLAYSSASGYAPYLGDNKAGWFTTDQSC